MTYKITQYTRERARVLNVSVRVSTKKNKKIDVLKDGKLLASVGDVRYLDYPTYIAKYGMKVAKKRRMMYKKRHQKTRRIKGSPSYYADQLLW